MSELCRIEWTLSEGEEYMRWFSAPHMATEDDESALRGLRDELT